MSQDIFKGGNIVCPFCNTEQKIRRRYVSHCAGVFVTCENEGCSKEFEIYIENGRQQNVSAPPIVTESEVQCNGRC